MDAVVTIAYLAGRYLPQTRRGPLMPASSIATDFNSPLLAQISEPVNVHRTTTFGDHYD